MILDSRIKEGKRPLTCLDVEQAREFEGKLCLFSSSFANYKNICEYARYQQYTGTLSVKDKDKFKYIADEESPYRNENDGYFYELVLPLEWVKKPEKKYRPYIVMEFIKEYPLGSHLHFRPKDKTIEMHRLIDGYNDCPNGAGTVFMCGAMYSMSELYNNYEICINGEWKPFGIEVEE